MNQRRTKPMSCRWSTSKRVSVFAWWTTYLVTAASTGAQPAPLFTATPPPCAATTSARTDCSDGQIWSVETGCVTCGIGLVPDAASKTCVPCRAGVGQVSNVTGASSCVVCPAGTWAFSKSLVDGVVAAPSRSKNAAEGSVTVLISDCLQCPLGRWAPAGDTGVEMIFNQTHAHNSTDSGPCRQCEDGSIASDGGSYCVACEPGTAAASGARECQPCGNGTYAPYRQMGHCVTCPPGTTSQVVMVESSDEGQGESGNHNSSGSTASSGTSSGTGTGTGGGEGTAVVVDGGPGAGSGPGPDGGIGAGTGISVGDVGVGSATAGLNAATTPLPHMASMFGASVCIACEPGWFGSITRGTCSKCHSGQFSAIAGQTQCRKCAAGYFSHAQGSSACTLCRAGRFSNVSGIYHCFNCSAGHFSSTEGNTHCKKCPVGTFQLLQGSSGCKSCSEGFFSGVEGTRACSSCAVGRYAGSTRLAECKECGQGRFANITGASRCQECPAGRFRVSGMPYEAGEACDACPAGTWSLSSSGVCKACEIGRVAALPGSETCEWCPNGYFGSSNGSVCWRLRQCPPGLYQTGSNIAGSSCRPCSPGTFSIDGRGCNSCPQGWFANESGSSACVQCAAGQFSAFMQATHCTPCLPGRFADGVAATQCDLCDVDTHAPQMGSSNCTRCIAPEFTFAAGSPSCASCEVGKYRVFMSVEGNCLAAPCFGSSCVEGEIVAKENYYVFYDDDIGGRRALIDEGSYDCSGCKGGSHGPCVDWTSGYCLDYAPGSNGSCPPATLPCSVRSDHGTLEASTPTHGQCTSAECWPWSTGDCVDSKTTVCRPVADDTRECSNSTNFCEAGASGFANAGPVEFVTTIALFLANALDVEALTDRSSAKGSSVRESLRCAVADMGAVSCEYVSLLSIAYMVTGHQESRRLQGQATSAHRMLGSAEGNHVFATLGFDFSAARIDQDGSATNTADSTDAAARAFNAANTVGEPGRAYLLRAALSTNGIDYYGRGAFVAALPTPKQRDPVQEYNCDCNEGTTSTTAVEVASTTTSVSANGQTAPGLGTEAIGALAAAGGIFVGAVIAIIVSVVRCTQARKEWNRQTSNPIAAHVQKQRVTLTCEDMEAQGR